MWLGENLYYYEWIYLFSFCLEFFKQKKYNLVATKSVLINKITTAPSLTLSYEQMQPLADVLENSVLKIS